MFMDIIAECRSVCERRVSHKKKQIKDLDERPEVNVAGDVNLPRRGIEKTQPFGDPAAPGARGFTSPGRFQK